MTDKEWKNVDNYWSNPKNKEWENKAKSCELSWWLTEFTRLGKIKFEESRRIYFEHHIGNFSGNFKPKGNVVNIGTGLLSIFRFINATGKKVEVDPSIERFVNISKKINWKGIEKHENTLKLKDKSFDTVICLNTIDHTSKPNELIEEIHRIMKDDGRLFLEVNFDRYDSPAHYQKFSEFLVKELFEKKFKIIFTNIETDCGPTNSWDEYYVIMEKKVDT